MRVRACVRACVCVKFTLCNVKVKLTATTMARSTPAREKLITAWIEKAGYANQRACNYILIFSMTETYKIYITLKVTWSPSILSSYPIEPCQC